MKIALCLFGQPRNYRIGYKNLEDYLLSKYNVDKFAHIWWSKEMAGETYDSSPWAPNNYIIEGDLDKKINSLYKFNDVIFQTPQIFKPLKKYIVHNKDHDSIYDSLKSRFYSLNRVLSLAKSYNTDYDFLIVTRYDIGIRSLPDFNNLNEDNIYVPNMHIGRKDIFNDNFWIFGKNHKYVFENLYSDFDKNYDMIQNMPIVFKEKLSSDSELNICNYLNGEQFFSFHLLFNNCLDKVKKDPQLNANLIR